MMPYGKRVTFHEEGRTFYWYIASREVYDEYGGRVAGECYNLAQARNAAHGSIRR